jgi:hypothetical protein
MFGFWHGPRKSKHPNFEMIKKYADAPDGAESQVQVIGNTISTCGPFNSTIVFNDAITFQLGPGTIHMGWCNTENPHNNIIINLKYGSYSLNGIYNGRTPHFRDNSHDLCAKEGDIISFTNDGQSGPCLMINGNVAQLIIAPRVVEDADITDYNIICYIEDGSITVL